MQRSMPKRNENAFTRYGRLLVGGPVYFRYSDQVHSTARRIASSGKYPISCRSSEFGAHVTDRISRRPLISTCRMIAIRLLRSNTYQMPGSGDRCNCDIGVQCCTTRRPYTASPTSHAGHEEGTRPWISSSVKSTNPGGRNVQRSTDRVPSQILPVRVLFFVRVGHRVRLSSEPALEVGLFPL